MYQLQRRQLYSWNIWFHKD